MASNAGGGDDGAPVGCACRNARAALAKRRQSATITD